MPDLLLWRPATQDAKLSEVKGPRDSLSNQQRAWIAALLAAGLDCEVAPLLAPLFRPGLCWTMPGFTKDPGSRPRKVTILQHLDGGRAQYRQCCCSEFGVLLCIQSMTGLRMCQVLKVVEPGTKQRARLKRW